MISIITRSELDESAYVDLQAHSESSLIYTDLNYLDAISEYTKADLFFIVDIEATQYIAALAFCVLDGPFGKVANSLPFYGSNGGVILRNSLKLNYDHFVKAFLDFSKMNSYISVTIIESPLRPLNLNNYSTFNFIDSRIGLLNHFEPRMNELELIESFDDPRPRNIRKAEKAGVTVAEARSEESIKFLTETHIKNMIDIGGSPKNSDFFFFLLNKLPRDQWIIFEALYEGERIASLLLLYNHNVVEYFTPATCSQFRNIQAQSLLIYHGMRFAIDQNIPAWNWGGTWKSQNGVYDFKRKWGPKEYIYKYYCAVLDNSLLNKKAQEILDGYPNFYVLPFSELKG